jgi:hypothetical protein
MCLKTGIVARRYLTFVGSLVLSTSLFAASPAKLTYQESVAPILREKCFTCHGPDRKSGGLRLSTYSDALAGGASGEAIKPGDPEGSLLYKLITHQQEPYMPPRSPQLPKDTVAMIAAWIESGALENAGSKAQVVNKPKLDVALSAVARGKPEGPPPMPENLVLEPVVHTLRAGAITALATSPWAPVVAIGGQKQIVLYNTDTLEFLGILPFPEGVAHVLKFSRNGKLLLAGGGKEGKSGRVIVWNVTNGQRIFEIGDEMDAVLAADISADQSQIALGGPGKIVRVYSTKDGKLLHEIKKHTDWIYSLEFSPDGVLLASADRSGGLYVWEAFTAREYFTLRGHTGAITDVSWRADGNVLASSSEDGTIRLWEMENGTQARSWNGGGPVQAVKFAYDGRLVSSGRDRLVRLWQGNGAGLRALEPFADVAMRTAFSHDGARVIGGDWTGDVRVWSGADGAILGHLSANPPPLVEQMDKAAREVASLEVAYPKLAAAVIQSQKAAEKATAELASAQKLAGDTAAAARIVADALARARLSSERAEAALAAAHEQTVARVTVAAACAEAANRIKAVADKSKSDKALADEAARSAESAARTAADLAAAQKVQSALQQQAALAREQLASAQRAAGVTCSAAASAAKRVSDLAPPAKSAGDAALADKAAADKAARDLNLARATLARCRAAQARAK